MVFLSLSKKKINGTHKGTPECKDSASSSHVVHRGQRFVIQSFGLNTAKRHRGQPATDWFQHPAGTGAGHGCPRLSLSHSKLPEAAGPDQCCCWFSRRSPVLTPNPNPPRAAWHKQSLGAPRGQAGHRQVADPRPGTAKAERADIHMHGVRAVGMPNAKQTQPGFSPINTRLIAGSIPV